MKATATCTTCGGELAGGASPLGNLCPACVIRASCTPETRTDGSLTTWAEVFPQLEVERILREEAGLSVYLAEVVGEGDARKAVLQVASGKRFAEAGGVAALTTRAQRLSTCEIEGLAPVLDFGDLADAFFWVTEAPDLPSLPEALEGKDAAALSLLVRAVTEETEAIIQAARATGVSLRADPDLCFVEEETGRVVLTPGLLPGEAKPSVDAPMITKLAAGDQLGAFRLEEMVGEGGFGKVWRARQERPVGRMVAVKVLKSGLHSQRARARFEVEQQALAKLDHPHIARFFDGGTTSDGRPYFAMEWIEGQSLVPFAKQSEASLKERLRLFRQVCEAVHNAHQKGIIHRDLKSSNVMVASNGEEPAAKVIDFGIARAVENPLVAQTQLTRAEEILGTPAAMSPEQAAGAGGSELDARTDVYGLGVLLYELLSGELPFDPKLPADELRRQIREEDPPKPSSRIVEPAKAKAVRGDLDWITRRCLEKDPERRYRSVSALMRDLERHAEHQPVEAGPPEIAYRAKKFVRRNRAVVAGSVVALVALVVGLVLALDGYRQANFRTIEAQDARATAEAEANNASEVTAFLKEHFFGQLNPGANPNSDLTLAEAVRHASEALDDEPLNAPEVEGEIRMTLAQSLEGLGRYGDAEAHYRIAVDKLGSALGAEAAASIEAQAAHARVLSELGQHREACALQQRVVEHWSTRDGSSRHESLRARRNFARYLMAGYRLRDGVAVLERVFEEQRERFGIDDLETLESLAELSLFYESEERDFDRAEALRRDLDPASIYREGSLDSIAMLHRMVELHEDLSNEDIAVLRARLEAARTNDQTPRVEALRLELEFAKALRYKSAHEEVIAVCEPILTDLETALGPTHPFVFEAYHGLIWAMFHTGARNEIPALIEPVLARLDPEHHLPEHYEALAGRYYGLFGKWKEATRLYRDAASRCDLRQLRFGIAAAMMAEDDRTVDTLRTEMLIRFGDTDDPYAAATIAETLLDISLLNESQEEKELERVAHYLEFARAQRPERGKTWVVAMRLALAQGNFETASRLADEAADWAQRVFDNFDRNWIEVVRILSAAHLGNLSRAELLLRGRETAWMASFIFRLREWPDFVPIALALDEAEKAVLQSSPRVSWRSPDRFGVSEAAYEAGIVEKRRRAIDLTNEGVKLNSAGRTEEALAAYRAGLSLYEETTGVGAGHAITCRRNIGRVFISNRRYVDAIRAFEETLAIQERFTLPDAPSVLRTKMLLGASLASAGSLQDNAEQLQEGVALLNKTIPDLQAWSASDTDLRADLKASTHHLAAALTQQAYIQLKAGNPEEALSRFLESLPHFEASDGRDSVISFMTRRNIIYRYHHSERHEDAIRVAKETVEILEESRPAEDLELVEFRSLLAYSLSGAGRDEEAIDLLEKLIPRMEVAAQSDGEWLNQLETALDSLASWYREAGENGKAEDCSARFNTIAGPRLGVPVAADTSAATAVLVPPTSEWRWLHPVDGVDPAESDPDFHQTFFLADFDDSQWRSGRDSEGPSGGFGYGDDGFTGIDIGTPTGEPNADGQRQGKAAYFRHRFKTEQPYTKLKLRCQRDDGIIVYLDGAQVGRSNMSDGNEAYSLPAFSAVGGDNETTIYRIPLKLPNGDLPVGEHILAISLHNPAKPSSDLRIGGITLVVVE